jgi:hypothetical protein
VKRLVLIALSNLLFFLVLSKFILRGLRRARADWREDPIKTVSKIIFSFIIGQGVFNVFGYDQLGWFMRPHAKLGFGKTVSQEVYDRIPHTATTAWAIKVIEILMDATKIPIEGLVYLRFGFVSDGVAAAVSQPAWSSLETAEKAVGAALHPERVVEPDQVMNSIGCIYGSFFRIFQAIITLLLGRKLYRLIGSPIEFGLRKVVSLVRK